MNTHILCLETSGLNCSVAITKNQNIIAHKSVNSGQYSHAECLHIFIEDVVKQAKISLSDLSAVSLSQGPGSFTGLRIGTSAAKGLCFALQIPLITISSLEILARQALFDGTIIPMFDARRMEVYAAVFNSDYEQIQPTQAVVLNENSFEEVLSKGKTLLLGNGADKFEKLCHHPNASFLKNASPDAKNMGEVSFKKYQQQHFTDVVYFEPDYLKPFHLG